MHTADLSVVCNCIGLLSRRQVSFACELMKVDMLQIYQHNQSCCPQMESLGFIYRYDHWSCFNYIKRFFSMPVQMHLLVGECVIKVHNLGFNHYCIIYVYFLQVFKFAADDKSTDHPLISLSNLITKYPNIVVTNSKMFSAGHQIHEKSAGSNIWGP